MTDAEPAMGEVMRRLDATARQMVEISADLRSSHIQNAATYVSREFFTEARGGDQRRVADLGDDIATLAKARAGDATFRRQALLAMAVMGLTVVANIFIAVANLLAR